MKRSVELNMIKALLFCFFLSIFTQAEAGLGRKTKIDIKFGIGGRNCKGFGICLIYDPIGSDPLTFSLLESEKDLIKIEIPYARVKQNPGLFEGDYFIMEAPYEIPLDICKKIGLELPVVLTQGKHKIYQGTEGVIIEFETEIR